MPITARQLSEYLDRHWGPLLVWVGQCDGMAEDVVQQAFIALSAQAIVPENPVAWLYKTSRHFAINERKKLCRHRVRQAAVAQPESQPCELWQTEQSADLADQLRGLPDELRETVVAHIWGEMPFAEIAAITGRSQATVWRQYQSALDQLRQSEIYDAYR